MCWCYHWAAAAFPPSPPCSASRLKMKVPPLPCALPISMSSSAQEGEDEGGAREAVSGEECSEFRGRRVERCQG